MTDLIVKPLSPDVEYKKNPDIKKEDIAKLREWLEKQHHLPNLSELELILYYHSCEGSMELAKKTIDLNFTMKAQWKEIFEDYDPKSSKNVHALETVLITALPGVTKEGYKVLYGRLMDFNPANFFLETKTKICTMIGELMLLEGGSYPGVVIMLDMEGVVLGHVGRLGLMTIKKVTSFLQEAVPMRLKGFHFINTPSFMDRILVLLKPFIKKNFADMLHLHPAPIDTIYEFIDKKQLPKELGGDGDTCEQLRIQVQAWLTANRETLLQRGAMKADESKRPEKPKYIGDIMGTEGSFKRLDID